MKRNKQLYELTLHELETEYQIVNPAIQDLSFRFLLIAIHLLKGG
ncbi:Fur-regulated basic protein FbpA [Priestia megaterium]